MRRAVQTLVASSVLSLISVTPILAMDGLRVVAKIPFSFTAAEKSFPAGEYTFTMDDPEIPTLLAITSDNGERYELMLTEPKNLKKPADGSKLVFEEYGNQRYLSQVWVAGTGTIQVIPLTTPQKEVAQHAERHETLSIPARKS
jgi:hypothetical protein